MLIEMTDDDDDDVDDDDDANNDDDGLLWLSYDGEKRQLWSI